MKKNTTKSKGDKALLIIGLDIGDKYCHFCALDESGEVWRYDQAA